MKIKVLGTGCPNCLSLEANVKRVVNDNNIDAEIIAVKDIEDIIAYNVMSTPALVVNENVVSKGRIPSDKELLEFFTS